MIDVLFISILTLFIITSILLILFAAWLKYNPQSKDGILSPYKLMIMFYNEEEQHNHFTGGNSNTKHRDLMKLTSCWWNKLNTETSIHEAQSGFHCTNNFNVLRYYNRLLFHCCPCGTWLISTPHCLYCRVFRINLIESAYIVWMLISNNYPVSSQ